jgi:phosphate:Na+ symporter
MSNLSEEESWELVGIMEAANDLEAVGDIIETNLVSQGLERLEAGFRVSPATQKVLGEVHALVLKSVDLSLQAVAQRSMNAAIAVVEMKGQIGEMLRSASIHEVRRLVADEPNRLEAYTVEVDILQNFRRIYYFAKRMARGVLPREG